MRRRLPRLLCLLTALQLLTMISRAELLPIKTYTTGEGLPSDEVRFLRQDSRGFLWMAAGDGLSRFDGYKFTNYSTKDGLADRRVNDLLETRKGTLLVATSGGLSRFNPTGHPRLFTTLNPDPNKRTSFNALAEDANQTVWAASDNGLYKLHLESDGTANFQRVELEAIPGRVESRMLTALHFKKSGALWCGTRSGTLYEVLSDKRVEHYLLPTMAPVNVLLEDNQGRMWVGTTLGLYRLVSAPARQNLVAQSYGPKEGLADSWINGLHQTAKGTLWIATPHGLYSLSGFDGPTANNFQRYGTQNNLCDGDVWDVVEDRNGNLWMATRCGVQRVARNGFTTYGTTDGLSSNVINSLFENAEGTLFVVNSVGIVNPTSYGGRPINRFDGSRFTAVPPNPLPLGKSHGWGWLQTVLQDHLGDWWIPTGWGLFRYPKRVSFEHLSGARASLFHAGKDELGEFEIFRLYEDAHDDLWIAVTNPRFELWRWERATNTLHNLTKSTGVSPGTDFTVFAEDHDGNLWIGTSEASLLRYSGGNFRRFVADDGIPPGWIICLLVDHVGRLWIGSQLSGLNRIDDPTASTLRLARYTTTAGLSSDNIRSLTEDRWGRIYVGTGHGVDRLTPDSGNVRHYTVADGLVKGKIEAAFRDRNNALWFGSWFGLSRFVPEQVDSDPPPSVFLTGLRVNGNPRDVSQLGETNPRKLELSSGENNMSIDFVGLGSSLGEELGYQYRLVGADSEWGSPTTDRTINFANLGPGTYQFQVRARNAEGVLSLDSAVLDFEIASSLWKRWWFLSLLACLVGLAIYSFYRSRLGRMLELERIRTRIATDLHDDVGSGLSQVSILSEVISRQVGHQHGVGEQLSTIGSLSRDLVDSMSDIVWAINPAMDRLSDLSHRMRRFASDVFIAQGVELTFDFPQAGHDVRLGPEMRRELYLIFKEAVTNVASHSHCTAVRITFLINDGALELSVQDNGDGFDLDCESEGNGLANMHLRARKLGGMLRISANNGTVVNLIAPLKVGRRFGFSRNLS